MTYHVLLVENDTWLADSYARLLSRAGYAVRHASTAHDAMRIIDDEAPDVIIADIVLEHTTIFTLLHELQSYRDTRDIPVVLCSSFLLQPPTHFVTLHAYGVRTVLDKTTLTPTRLIDTVHEVLL